MRYLQLISEGVLDRTSTFVKHLGDLVACLSTGSAAAAAPPLALAAAEAAAASLEVVTELESQGSEDLPLRTRLRARGVGGLRVEAGAPAYELLSLAEALVDERRPVISTEHVAVRLVDGTILPKSAHRQDAILGFDLPQRRSGGDRRSWAERRRSGRPPYGGSERRERSERRTTGERRLHLVRAHEAEAERLAVELRRHVQGLAWEAVLPPALALVALAGRLPPDLRRLHGQQIRGALPRDALEAMIDLAERSANLRPAASAVLQWVGLDAARVLLDRLSQGEGIGVRVFYYDTLGGMPGIYPLVTPLVTSRFVHEVRHAAVLLGRLGNPDAVGYLVPLLSHPDEGVRVAAVTSIGQLHDAPAAEPLREALRHTDARTRAATVEAITAWRGGALAELLEEALEAERDGQVWQALVTALGRIATPEACAALAEVALSRRARRQGYTSEQRLAAVAALGLSAATPARATLERLAREADGVVRYAAERVLLADDRRAG